MSSSPDAIATRRPYIDWARGLAVLIMIEAHVLDSWTAPSGRTTSAFGYLNILGGFAAPLFLWLAGLSLVMSAERQLAKTGDRDAAAKSVARRGLQVFALAFLFRLQSYIVSPGNPLVSLLRVDILNIMGPGMIAAAVLWRIGRSVAGATLLCSLAATALAMVTPLVRSAGWLGALPPVVQWYLSPAGNHSTFTLFPWAGFVLAGAAAGAVYVAGSSSPKAGRDGVADARVLAWFAVAGGVMALASWYASTLPSIYAASSFWTTSPTYFGLRVGLLLLLLAALKAVAPLAGVLPRASHVVERFGRHSLFVYWIHVELVYGYTTLVIHHRLPLWGTAMGFIAFTTAMYWSIALKEWAVGRWRGAHRSRVATQPAGAS